MKKMGILLIALIIIITGFISGCTQQSGTSNNKQNTLGSTEFINWTANTLSETTIQFEQVQNNWNSSWRVCLDYIRQAKTNIDLYINQSSNFSSLGDVLDSARFWFVEYLTAYKQMYEHWDLAVQSYIDGRVDDGNTYAQEGIDLHENAQIYLSNSAKDISYWKKIHEG